MDTNTAREIAIRVASAESGVGRMPNDAEISQALVALLDQNDMLRRQSPAVFALGPDPDAANPDSVELRWQLGDGRIVDIEIDGGTQPSVYLYDPSKKRMIAASERGDSLWPVVVALLQEYRSDIAPGPAPRAVDDRVRGFAELRSEGLLWLINRCVFHPRGRALALHIDGDTGEAVGWSLEGDGIEPFSFPAQEIEMEKAHLARSNAFLGPKGAS